jgi:hypothetical protein
MTSGQVQFMHVRRYGRCSDFGHEKSLYELDFAMQRARGDSSERLQSLKRKSWFGRESWKKERKGNLTVPNAARQKQKEKKRAKSSRDDVEHLL